MSETRTTSSTSPNTSSPELGQGLSRRRTLKAGAGVLALAALPIFKQRVPLSATGSAPLPLTAPVRSGRLEAFGRGADHGLHHIWQVAPGGAWGGWAPLGGGVDQPVIGRNGDGRLEAFVVGNDHALWHIWRIGGGWSGWATRGGWIDQLAVDVNA